MKHPLTRMMVLVALFVGTPLGHAEDVARSSPPQATTATDAANLLHKLMRGTKSAAPRVTPPGERSTPASRGLPPGPRVFICAHSFMIFTGQLLPPLAEAAGIAYQDAGTQMLGGSRTLQHWNVPDGQNLAKKALQAGTVDVLLVSPHLLLPDEGIDDFTKLGLEKNPKLRVLVQASWPTRDGNLVGTFKNEMRNAVSVADLQQQRAAYEAMWLRSLEEQVRRLNATLGRPVVSIVPVGKAVFALRERIAQGAAPGLHQQTELFKDDLGHPLPPLAALVTYCHFAALYGRSPVGLPVPASLKSLPRADELNSLLQDLAWRAVSTYAPSGVNAAPAAGQTTSTPQAAAGRASVGAAE